MFIYGRRASFISEGASLQERAIAKFLKYLESRLGVYVISSTENDSELRGALQLAQLMLDAGIIVGYGKSAAPPDEPRLFSWKATCADWTRHQVGGASWNSESEALYAALAEALERYIWLTQEDYFIRPRFASEIEIAKHGFYIPPDRFVGYSASWRAKDPAKQLRAEARYLWIRGLSLINNQSIYIPAQTVSGIRSEHGPSPRQEPVIRRATTNGLATWSTRTGARNRGMLELIERDAYMIMWLNQLTLPRIYLAPLALQHGKLANVLAVCERYRLKVHAINLLTDAPACAIAVVLEDESSLSPRFTIGLKAHQSLPEAVLGALTEALRARKIYRRWAHQNTWDPRTPIESIGHFERLYYWGQPEHASALEWMVNGAYSSHELPNWETQTEAEYQKTLIRWCREKEFECIAVSLGTSRCNPTPLYIEMMVVPELQPMYLNEKHRTFGGTRWQTVPALFGYESRKEPYADSPHPFV